MLTTPCSRKAAMVHLDWTLLEDGTADAWDGHDVQMAGWWMPAAAGMPANYGLLMASPGCCGEGAPAQPGRVVEVMLAEPLAAGAGPLHLAGHWQRLANDPSGWRYRLLDARAVLRTDPATRRAPLPGRRLFLAAGAGLGLVACAPGRFGPYAESQDAAAMEQADAARVWLANALTIDMHSHAGRVLATRDAGWGLRRAFAPVAAPMREGGMNVICLAIVADTLTTRISADGHRFEPYRTPEPGELYAFSQAAFGRAAALIAHEQLRLLTHADQLGAMDAQGPAVILCSEGADFLEGRLDRVDEAYHRHGLRHLQLTHYRVNELGDIQTEAPVHGGLTSFGADVVRRCNALGMVVDVAHGTYELVKRAASVTTAPLVLSHSSLDERRGPRSRQITASHARAVAETGGVIGVWPNGAVYADLDAMARGARQLADAVGVAHVGLGSDMLGFTSPPVLQSYRQMPQYAAALLRAGFSRAEVTQVLGGNYARVFKAALAPRGA